MAKFVRYHVPALEGLLPYRVVRVKKFDVGALDIPARAISFKFFHASNAKAALKENRRRVAEYHLVSPDTQILTTQQIRLRSRLHDLFEQSFGMFDPEVENPLAAFINSIEFFKNRSPEELDHMASMIPESESDPFHGDIFSEHQARFMEMHKCHRVMGEWPLACQGIRDKDFILNRENLEILSPAIKPTKWSKNVIFPEKPKDTVNPS